MAAELALAALEPAIEIAKLVTDPIKRQFNYICCFTANIDSLKDEAKNLEDALSRLEGEVGAGRNNVQEPVAEVATWLTKSKEMKDKISGILTEAENVGSGCSKLGARFHISRRAKKTAEHTEKLRGEKPEAEFQLPPIPARQAVPLRKPFECESRNQIEEEIMTALRGGAVNMIGICGMGGLGKTTMAKKIMKRVLNHDFEEVVMATISQDVNISKIQDVIAEPLGLKLDEEKQQTARVHKLLNRLSGTRRILLVLDDIWEELVLEDIGIPRDYEMCTILLTSRNRNALRDMDAQIFGMKELLEDEAWSYFRERVGTCVDDNPIAKQVAKECGGLPLALEVIGRGLKDERGAAIWKNALRELKQRVPGTVQFDKGVYALRWSYNRLNPDENGVVPEQSLFLLCCLFPEDADITLEYLTYFCMGLGIFENNTYLEDAKNKMCASIKILKDRSLLLESDKEDCVRMHDVVRDVCIFIAKEKGYIGKDDCPWISSSHLIGEGNELLSGSRCPNSRLLFLNRRYNSSSGFQFDDAFVEWMKELKVLCIQNYNSLTTLPRPKQSFGKLHTLILRSCYELESISVVGELVNLEILICRECYSIEELPAEMKGLHRLKLLELTKCQNLQSIGRGVISSLVALEELKMHRSFDGWEAEDSKEKENASINELEALTNLTCLEIDIQDPSLLEENLPCLSTKIVRFRITASSESSKFKFRNSMALHLERESRLGDWIDKKLLKDTECLCLSGDGANNVDWAKIPKIWWLEFKKCGSMKNIARTSGGSDDATVFPSLKHLRLYSLDNLEVICDGPLFSNLSSIVIMYCPRLRNLGQLSMAGTDCLPQLEKLSIWYCSMMEQVFLWNDNEAGQISIESQRTCHVITKVFPKLKDVWLRYLPNLTSFYQGIEGIEFPLLVKMRITECPKLKRIIGSSGVDIDDDDDDDDDGSLHLFCQPQKESLGSLQELRIIKVGSKSIFTLSMAANLVSLRELFLIYCDEMIKAIDYEQHQQRNILVFPKLERLYLIELPKLEAFCDWKCEVELPLLRELYIERCPSVRNLSLGLIATPNLEAFTTDLTTYVGVEVDVSIDGIKVSFGSRLEELRIYNYVGSMSLFSLSMAANLVSLRKLSLELCDEMIKVIEDQKQVASGVERILVFPKLEVLELIDFPKLVSFCDWKGEVKLPALKKVNIIRCLNMKNFSLGLVATPNLEAFSTDLSTYVGIGDDVSFHSLKELVIRENENPLNEDKISVSLFNGLEKLEFFRYKGSMSLLSSSVVGNLVSLKQLHIRRCNEIVEIIKDEEEDGKVVVSGGEIITSVVIFPKLEVLHLEDLPKLVRFCKWKCDILLPSLRELKIIFCPNMKNFSMGFVSAPNLNTVNIGDEYIDATKDLNGTLQQHYSAHQAKENEEEESSQEEDEIQENDSN